MCNIGDWSLSVEFDHWQDANKRSLLGVVVSYGDNGSKYLLDIVDVSTEGHGSNVTVDRIKTSLECINPSSINSFISDSASACKAAREQLVISQPFQHVIQHRCLAHLINLVGKHISKDSCMAASIRSASKLAGIVANNSRIVARIREAQNSRVVPPCSARWYSQVDMIQSLIDAKTVILEEMENYRDQDSVISEDVWCTISRALQVLRPFAGCIGLIERSSTSLGEAMKAILDEGKRLFSSDWSDPFNLSAITAYLTYICPNKLNNDEFGLLLAAYATDNRHKMDYLTEDAMDLILNILIKIAKQGGDKMSFIQKYLLPEFEEMALRQGVFALHTTQTASSWWCNKRDSGGLRPVALRLAKLKASSANIERCFSSLKYIQGTNRLNLLLKTFCDLGRVKISIAGESSEECNGGERNFREPVDEEQVEDHKPELLAPQTLENYHAFSKYIDFTKINQRGCDELSDQQVSEDTDVTELLRLSRASRAQKKAQNE